MYFETEYDFLNLTYPSPVTLTFANGKEYTFTCARVAFEAMRCPTIADQMQGLNPKDAVALRNAHPEADEAKIDSERWKQRQPEAMALIQNEKFRQHPDLAKRLADIKEPIVYEEADVANNKYWGVTNGEGQNLLGKAIEKARSAVQAFEAGRTMESTTATYRINAGMPVRDIDTIAGRTVREYRAEAIYSQMMLVLNAKLGRTGGKPLIMTTEARALHQIYISELRKAVPLASRHEVQDIETAITNALNTALQERTGIEIPRANVQRASDTFTREIGGTEGVAPIAKNCELRLSPYDEAHSMNEVFLENGARTLYANVIRFDSDEKKYGYGKQSDVYYKEDGRRLKTGMYERQSDQLRLGILSQIITDRAEMQAIYDNVRKAFTDSNGKFVGISNPVLFEELQVRAKHIVDTIKNHGYAVEYRVGTRPGQIDAVFNTGTRKLNVRIFDVSRYNSADGGYNFANLGLVYDKTSSISAYNTSKEKNGASGNMKSSFPDIKGSEIWPLSYMMGWDITDSNGNAIDLSAKRVQGSKNPVSNYAGLSGSSAKQSVFFEKDAFGNQVGVHTEYKSKGQINVIENPVQTLKEAVSSAKSNFEKQVGLENMFDQFDKNGTENDFMPVFSTDQRVAEVQQLYWNLLKGEYDTLVKPSKKETYIEGLEDTDPTTDMLQDLLAELGIKDGTTYDRDSMSPKEMAAAHLREYIDTEFGSLETDENGNVVLPDDKKTFDPVLVRDYMESSESEYSRNDLLADLIGKSNVPIESLRGEHSFFKDTIANRARQYDAEHSVPLSRKAAESKANGSSVLEYADHAIRKSIADAGCVISSDDSIRIDEHGIAQYQVYKIKREGLVGADRVRFESPEEAIAALNSDDETRRRAAAKIVQKVTGYVGPIFDYDKECLARGEKVVYPDFASGNGKAFVPCAGNAYVKVKEPGDTSNYLERTVVTSYERQIASEVRQTVLTDLLSVNSWNNDERIVGKPCNLLGTYGRVYKEQLPDNDFRAYYKRLGATDEEIHAKIDTMSRAYLYDKRYMENASLRAVILNKELNKKRGVYNDNFASDFRDVDGHNMATIDEESAGCADATATGNAGSMGRRRYLPEGASINENGTLNPSRNPDGSINRNARVPLAETESFKYSSFDGADRQATAFGNFLHELREIPDVGTAQVTLGGWTQDDGVVISKELAEKILVPDEQHKGELRPLREGDKLSDGHANKGVICLIVDRNMDSETAKQEKLEDVVKLFKDNPELDYVTSPYSMVSRQNAGTWIEANDSQTKPLIVNGEVRENCLGHIRVHVLKQTVDTKDKIEDANRKFGMQASWAFAEENAKNILGELFETNDAGWADMRDIVNVIGADFTADGKLIAGYEKQPNEDKKIFTIPGTEQLVASFTDENGTLDIKNLLRTQSKRFANDIGSTGGMLEIPFDMPTKVSVSRKDYYRTHKNADPNLDRNKSLVPAGNGNFLFPIMSPKLRSGTELYDETIKTHDYTNLYQSIYENALSYSLYSSFAATGSVPDGVLTKAELKDANNDRILCCQAKANACRQKAISDYASLQSMVENDFLTGRYNSWKTRVFTKRQRRSATLVVSADPRLNTEDCRISKRTAKALGLLDKHGNLPPDSYILVGRDPVQRSGAYRCMHVLLGNTDTIAVAPHALASCDGDFDGDSLGLLTLKNPAVVQEMQKKFSAHNNMLDYSAHPKEATVDFKNPVTGMTEKRTVKLFPLFFKTGLDMAAGQAANPELKKKYDEIEYKVNYFESLFKWQDEIAEKHPEFKSSESYYDDKARDNILKSLMAEYDAYCHGVYEAAFGRHSICYGDAQSAVDSFEKTVLDGSKGKMAALAECFNKAAGIPVEAVKDEAGNIVHLNVITNHEKCYQEGVRTHFTQDDHNQTQVAASAKTYFAGDAGKKSQQFYGLMVDRSPDAAQAGLETSQPTQQSIMQCKHDAQEAMNKIENLLGAYKDLLNGNLIVKYDVDGNRIPLSKVSEVSGRWEAAKRYSVDKDTDIATAYTSAISKEEFAKTFVAFFEDKDGMNVGVNPEFVEKIADAMMTSCDKWTEADSQGNVHQRTDRIVGLNRATLDSNTTDNIIKIAYENTNVTRLLQDADKVDLLNENSTASSMIPKTLKDNIQAIKDGLFEAVKPIMHSDQGSSFMSKAVSNNVFGVKKKESEPENDFEDDFGMAM